MDLSLDICAKHVHTIGDALCEFTKTELLDHDNMVMCSTCKVKQPVTKGLRFGHSSINSGLSPETIRFQ
jgi:ubiquitin C-terminal hydrolase